MNTIDVLFVENKIGMKKLLKINIMIFIIKYYKYMKNILKKAH